MKYHRWVSLTYTHHHHIILLMQHARHGRTRIHVVFTKPISTPPSLPQPPTRYHMHYRWWWVRRTICWDTSCFHLFFVLLSFFCCCSWNMKSGVNFCVSIAVYLDRNEFVYVMCVCVLMWHSDVHHTRCLVFVHDWFWWTGWLATRWCSMMDRWGLQSGRQCPSRERSFEWFVVLF